MYPILTVHTCVSTCTHECRRATDVLSEIGDASHLYVRAPPALLTSSHVKVCSTEPAVLIDDLSLKLSNAAPAAFVPVVGVLGGASLVRKKWHARGL